MNTGKYEEVADDTAQSTQESAQACAAELYGKISTVMRLKDDDRELVIQALICAYSSGASHGAKTTADVMSASLRNSLSQITQGPTAAGSRPIE